MISPEHSSCPANIDPHITKSAPAPKALAISPGTVIPPSEITLPLTP